MGQRGRGGRVDLCRVVGLVFCAGLILVPGGSLWGLVGAVPDVTSGPVAWQGDLTPIDDGDWSYSRAAHLLERAGFGGTPEEVQRLAAMTPEAAVDYLVDYEGLDASFLPPFEESGIFDEDMLADVDDALAFGEGLARARERGEVYGVAPREGGIRPFQPVIDRLYYRNYSTRHEWNRAILWWAERMLLTPRPLEEKMALFWHGHFATEQEKVRDYRLMLDQLTLLRENATGNFRDLLLGISQDPAMLIYLDNRKNVKGQANENFAREIMELFALGVGNYGEDDIKEAARAFTGWTNVGRRFEVRPELHDDGEKMVLGRTGRFDGEDVVDILLGQPACAEFISRKVYRYLVREEISAELNRELASVLRREGYELKPFLKVLLRSRDFYAPASYATQIKSPVHFLISTYRKLGLERVPGSPYFPLVTAQLGQRLGNPPNVKGWDGGRAWINPSTLIERGNVVSYLLFPERLGEAYRYGPFEGRYQRYKNAPAECFARDRELALGEVGGGAAGASAMPEGSMGGASEATPGPGPTMAGGGMAMAAPSASMINETPQYDLPLGVYNGMNRAFRRVKPVDQTPARIDLTAMVQEAGAATAPQVVDYFVTRFVRLPLEPADRQALIGFLRARGGGEALDLQSPETEAHLRELLHLIMSTSEYQLG